MSKKLLQDIYFTALNKVKAKNTIADNISIDKNYLKIVDKKIPLKTFNNLFIFAVGKAAFDMAKKSEEILKDHIKGGVVISNKDQKLKFLDNYQSSHPILTQKSIDSADHLIKKMKSLKKDDFYIFLLSGGASAMIEKPMDGLNLDDFKKISKALIGSGIDISALNSIRKSISKVKGGKLAKFTKADGVTLVLSDVIGDDLGTIGSAPMYNKKVPHYIIANNKIALDTAKKFISKKIKKVKVLTNTFDLSSEDAAKYILRTIKKYDEKHNEFCLLLGGETTTEVKGKGKGGRNQELALRLLLQNCITKDISILCAGSDGIDGNSDSTGAFLDFDIYKKIDSLKIDPKTYLQNSDSNSFFKKLKYDFTIGATGTNVMDFIIILKQKNR